MTDTRQFVLFPVGDRDYAMAAEKVFELVPAQTVNRFPHTTPEILGVIVRRGRVIPVYAAAGWLGLAAETRQQYQLIAIRQSASGAELAALPVSGECNLVFADLQPPKRPRPGVTGEIEWRDKTYDVLDLDQLIPAVTPTSQTTGLSGTPAGLPGAPRAREA